MVLFRHKISSLALSLAVHGTVLAAGSFLMTSSPEYGVQVGSGGADISMTAAPAELVSEIQADLVAEDTELIEIPDQAEPEPMPLPEASQEQKVLETKPRDEQKQVQMAHDASFKGDGSSQEPGKDATTFYSTSGAIAEAAPHYLKNPAPHYPWEARQNGWEGVVVLRVVVGRAGNAQDVQIEQGSGYAVLDQSAVKAIKKWRFKAAQVGNLPIESLVRIPIRFELDQGRRQD